MKLINKIKLYFVQIRETTQLKTMRPHQFIACEIIFYNYQEFNFKLKACFSFK